MKPKIKELVIRFLPYALIISGLFLTVSAPLSFYSNSNLSVSDYSAKALNETSVFISDNHTIGGDVSVDFSASQPITPLKRKMKIDSVELTATAVEVVDFESGQVLFSKNNDQARPLASISKLMSAMVLLDLPIDWSATTTIESIDGNSDQIVLLGEEFTLEDLWHSALVGSSNKALKAIIRASNFNLEDFVDRMNKKAVELGLKSMKFADPTGLSPQNIGHAQDTTKLLKQALRFEKIYKTLNLREHYAKPLNGEKLRLVWSTDWLLTGWTSSDFNSNEIVGKTGYIPESDYNFVVSLKNPNNGRQILVAVLGSKTNEKRYEEARDIAEWAFAQYAWPGDDGYEDLVE